MIFMNGEAEDGANHSSACNQNRPGFDTHRIAVADSDRKDFEAHMAIAKQPHLWRKALRRADLPASAFKVALALVDEHLNSKTGRCFPGYELLAEECEISLSSVKNAVRCLRVAGLLTTRKQRFIGSNSYFLAIPAVGRMDKDLPLRDACEQTNSCPSNGQGFVPRTDKDLSPNISKEPLKVTIEAERTTTGPAASVVADAPQFDMAISDIHISQPPLVESEPHAVSDIGLDAPIERPVLYTQRRNILTERVGRNVELLQRLLEIWADQPLTERLIRSTADEQQARAVS